MYSDLGKRILVYFAVKGVLVKDCDVKLVREWHIPFESAPENRSMTLAKYNARFSLGFSESIATVAFDHPLQQVPDIVSDKGHVMTDGCAAMPLWAMQQIATAAQLQVLPSVVQGRIGAAKGVWYLDPFASNPQVRPSQVKWKLPFPTLEQRRFELCEWSRDRGPASLNYQFVYVLLHLGVPMETFVTLLREHAAHLRSDLVSELVELSFCFLKCFQQKVLRPRRTSQALPLLAAGFVPESSPYLRRLLSHSAGGTIGRLGERTRIPVDRSRWLMVVADPTGCLKFGQAFVHPSSLLLPLKGRVVVARNPCHLPSDVQVVECVAEPRLAHIRDALVLPVQGPYPPAQLLSGGDYDGDLVFLSWDNRLLPPAGCPERMPPPQLPVNPNVGATATATTTAAEDGASIVTVAGNANKSMRDCEKDITGSMVELFRNHNPVLGLLTQVHAAIAEKEGVASDDAIRVGWLCREAVDSPKSGARVRVPKSLAHYGMLGRDQVLPLLRAESAQIRSSFIGPATEQPDKETADVVLDNDLVLPSHTKWLTFARAEYADWRRSVHSALEMGDIGVEEVKKSFRRRYLQQVTKEGADRLALASAYYVSCASGSQAFAFSVCFRELIRIKADAQELRDIGEIALSTISRGVIIPDNATNDKQ